MKRKITPTPTDEEILKLDDVPVEVAATYIKKSTATIYDALQAERVPFGWAVQNKATGTWRYSISPGGLVKYKREGFPVLSTRDIQADIAEGVEQILTAKLAALDRVLAAVTGT